MLQYELYYIPTAITFPHELHPFPKELHFDKNHFSMGTKNCIIIKMTFNNNNNNFVRPTCSVRFSD
jgi:hypothetical protein